MSNSFAAGIIAHSFTQPHSQNWLKLIKSKPDRCLVGSSDKPERGRYKEMMVMAGVEFPSVGVK
ncbi:MAG TPA: hypothetical protein VMT55_04190, partial [Candidatus Sulfotelmatobacter sp.]|nr:hypothetical protein [Candidatus Sulfotelmatobacter sp.]